MMAAQDDPSISGLVLAFGAQVEHETGSNDLVHALISFANGETTPDWMSRAYETDKGDWLLWGSDGDIEVVSEADAKAVAEHKIEQERAFAVEVLDRAAEGTGPLIKRLIAAQKAGLRTRVSMSPRLQVKRDGTIRLVWHYTGPTGDLRGWTLFAGARLAEQAHGDQTDIGRCHLESCRRFFIIERGKIGKPQTKYCCDDHRLQRHALEAAERQRRSRSERARQPRRGK